MNAEIEVTGGTANPELNFPEEAFSGASGAADLGRNLETDPDFRIRREELLQLAGTATVEAIRSAVRNLDAVDQAFVFENASDTDFTGSGGLPPHSFEVVVLAPDSADPLIARTIFDNKAAGIQAAQSASAGPEGRTEIVEDSQGVNHTIEFSHATEVRMFIEVDVDVDQAIFGGGDQVAGETAIKEALRDFGRLLQIGDDVKILSFQCIPLDVAGVEDVPSMKIEDIFPPTNTANFVVDDREIATFSTADMTVNVNFV